MLVKKRKKLSPHGDKNASGDPFSKCEIKIACGSCRYVNEDYLKGLKEKFDNGVKILAETGVTDTAKILEPVPSPRKLAYRSTVKLAVRASQRREERFAIGLFKPESHDIVDLSYCPIHTRSIGRFIRAVKPLLEQSTLVPWDESTNKGDLRYLAVRASHLTDELMVTFVVGSRCEKSIKQIIDQLRGTDHNIHSAYVLLNNSAGNVIFDGQAKRIAGQDRLRESLCDLQLEISPTAFFQVNPWQAEQLYRRVEQIAGQTTDATAWDLYCGAGQMAMMLARSGYHAIGIEENPVAIADGNDNIKRNKLESRIKLICGPVENSMHVIPEDRQNPQLIVVNPSRKGLADSARLYLINILTHNPTTSFVYVSCDVKTLARDLKDLTRSGFKLRQIEAFDMFAQTDKLEWLAVMTK